MHHHLTLAPDESFHSHLPISPTPFFSISTSPHLGPRRVLGVRGRLVCLVAPVDGRVGQVHEGLAQIGALGGLVRLRAEPERPEMV